MLQVTLRVVGGDLASAEVPLQLPAIIGRGTHASVNLSHPLVSRTHCELRDEQGQLWVRDLDSLNGTFVGSERIVEATLRPGELLTVGTVTFRAMYEPAPTRDLDVAVDSNENSNRVKSLDFDGLSHLTDQDDTVRSEPTQGSRKVRHEATSLETHR